MGDMQFWLSFNNNAEKIQLPVNPPEIKVNSGYSWTSVPISGVGDYTIPSGHTLTEISISSFFPRDYAPYCEYEDIPNPWEMVKKIGLWKESRKPIRFIVTGTDGRINYAMTIERFDFWEKAGSPGDVYFTLDLREYRFISVKKIDLTPSKTTPGKTVASATSINPRPNDRQLPTTYTVKSGDTLSKIAQRMRTQGHKDITWRKIYDANKSVIGKDYNVIKPGQKLVIPK
jgi:nucleoid-associated protein YgaU